MCAGEPLRDGCGCSVPLRGSFGEPFGEWLAAFGEPVGEPLEESFGEPFGAVIPGRSE